MAAGLSVGGYGWGLVKVENRRERLRLGAVAGSCDPSKVLANQVRST